MLDREEEAKAVRVAHLVVRAKRVVVFTGAGVSTESGIPDFRSPGGFWTRFDPEDFTIDKFLASPETRRKQWRFLLSGDLLKDASPNAAHLAIARLEALGRLDCVITQNIDDLHRKAGNNPEKIFELHGNMHWVRCLACGRRTALAEMLGHPAADELPPCGDCGGLLKPDVIFFGEALPEATLREAARRAARCDLMMAVGSSLTVYPAASLPLAAHEAGASLVIVNLTATAADRIADAVIRGPAGAVMARIVAGVEQELGRCA